MVQGKRKYTFLHHIHPSPFTISLHHLPFTMNITNKQIQQINAILSRLGLQEEKQNLIHSATEGIDQHGSHAPD